MQQAEKRIDPKPKREGSPVKIGGFDTAKIIADHEKKREQYERKLRERLKLVNAENARQRAAHSDGVPVPHRGVPPVESRLRTGIPCVTILADPPGTQPATDAKLTGRSPMSMAVACQHHVVSLWIIKRKLALKRKNPNDPAGLTDLRQPGHAKNAPIILDGNEIVRMFEARDKRKPETQRGQSKGKVRAK